MWKCVICGLLFLNPSKLSSMLAHPSYADNGEDMRHIYTSPVVDLKYVVTAPFWLNVLSYLLRLVGRQNKVTSLTVKSYNTGKTSILVQGLLILSQSRLEIGRFEKKNCTQSTVSLPITFFFNFNLGISNNLHDGLQRISLFLTAAKVWRPFNYTRYLIRTFLKSNSRHSLNYLNI